MQHARRRARRAQLSDPHRRRRARRARARCWRRLRRAARVDRHQCRRSPRTGSRRCAQRSPRAGVAVDVVLVPDGEAHKNWATLHDMLTRLLELRAERVDDADRAGRRRRRRPRGLRRGDLPARHAVRAGADDAARAGRLVGRRQDRHQSSARQEHDRRVLPAARRADRHAIAWRRCPSASSPPASPK